MTEKIIDSSKKELVNNFEIKRATSENLPQVWGIIEKCSKWLADKGINHWANWYTEEMMGKLIKKKEVYLGYKNGEAVSTITFDTKPPKYYVTDDYLKHFAEPEAQAGYVLAVGVLPELQHQGLAKKMLQYTEDEAWLRKLKWLRLDCRAEDPGLAEFYERRGFKKVGGQPMKEGDNESYWLMEKSLV